MFNPSCSLDLGKNTNCSCKKTILASNLLNLIRKFFHRAGASACRLSTSISLSLSLSLRDELVEPRPRQWDTRGRARKFVSFVEQSYTAQGVCGEGSSFLVCMCSVIQSRLNCRGGWRHWIIFWIIPSVVYICYLRLFYFPDTSFDINEIGFTELGFFSLLTKMTRS